MKMTFVLLGCLPLLCAIATEAGAGDATAGAEKSAVCGACHGATGNSSNPEWPNLAGQHATYIAAQLALFKQGIRDNPLMMPNAMALSDQDMQDLGAHFEQQAPAGLEADPSNYKSGEKLYRGGDPERKLPACIACHGPQGKGNGPARYPALRSQHAVYTYNQLKAYAEGRRRGPGNDIMKVVAGRLTDAEMRALASYTQGLR
jgi:cytochrome c553